MKYRGFFIIVILFGAVAPVRADDPNAAKKAWSELFAQDDPAAADKQINEVLATCNNDPDRIRQLIAADDAYAAFQPGWQKHTAQFTWGDKSLQVEFFIRVPENYRTDQPRPLLLVAHDAGDTGEAFGRTVEKHLGKMIEKYVVVSPTFPFTGFMGQPRDVQAYLVPLQWTRTHLNIDDDRIYLLGYGQGGQIVWNLASFHPGMFAACVAVGGFPWSVGGPLFSTSYLENLQHVPFWAIWGEKDLPAPDTYTGVNNREVAERLKQLKNTRFIGEEIPDVRENQCWPTSEKLTAFFDKHKRGAIPGKFQFVFHFLDQGHGYYLQATKLGPEPIDLKKRIMVRVPYGTPNPRKEAARQMRKAVEYRRFRMWGTLTPADNSVKIQARGVTGVRLFFVEGTVNPARPATVHYWSKQWRGDIPTSARCLLEHYAATRDAGRLVLNEMDLSFKGSAKFVFGKD